MGNGRSGVYIGGVLGIQVRGKWEKSTPSREPYIVGVGIVVVEGEGVHFFCGDRDSWGI